MMRRFFSQIQHAARSSISPHRLGVALLAIAAAAGVVALARGSAPWGAPWAEAIPGTPAPLGAAAASTASVSRVDRALARIIDEAGVDRAAIRTRFVPVVTEGDSFSRVELDLPISRSTSFARMNTEITRTAGQSGASILDVIELGARPGSPQGLEFLLGVGDRATHRLTLKPEEDGGSAARSAAHGPKPPRIAVVIDDLGFSMNGLVRRLLACDSPLTFGVIAGLEHSVAFAESARARGHEVIVHVPMEPLDRAEHDPGRNAVLVELDPIENARRLRFHLEGIPEYTGASNHMGSRATADPAVMEVVMASMRERGRELGRELFFLDSKTSPFSVAGREARRAGVRLLVNNLFLDGARGSDVKPRAQTQRLEEIARRRGAAIGIGHVGEETVEAVEEAILRWKESGVEIVTLSELAGTAGDRPRPQARRPS
jgi:polysaccharide deacetylase 2 family uncharacterized protein YibQ